MNKTIKAIIATGALTLGFASAAFAQGQINFFTSNANPAKGIVYMPDGTTPAGSSFVGQLFYSDLSANGAMTALSQPETFNSSGIINFGNVTDTADDAGNFIWYELVVWTSAAGNTYQAATGLSNPGNGVTPPVGTVTPGSGLTAYGTSAVTKVLLGGVDASDNVFTVAQANGFNNLTLTPVPEPTTIALGGLGAAALLAFRRRK